MTENLLLRDANGPIDIKLIDFGSSVQTDHNAKTMLGTLGYVAPEVLKGRQYTAAVGASTCGLSGMDELRLTRVVLPYQMCGPWESSRSCSCAVASRSTSKTCGP